MHFKNYSAIVGDKIHQVKKGLFVLFSAISTLLFSQQNEIYNQFFMNPYLYNPAYAGVEGHTVVFLLYNQKWAKIDDSPTLSHVSFHTPLKGGIGIGAAGLNLTQGLITKSLGKFSASYLLTFDRKHHLRFGMSVGAGTQSLSFGELDDPTDPAFLNLAEQSTFMVADFGATYHFGHFNVGFSMPNLIGYDIFQESNFAGVSPKPFDNLILKMNYRGHLTDDIAIEPHIIYRYSNLTQNQFEAVTILHIYHVIWAGATYRQDNTIALTIGTKIKEKIGIGYAYELGNASIASSLGSTHEIHLGIHLGTRKEHHAHVSSFIKSHRLTPEERAEKAAREREERLQALRESREPDQTEQTGDELSIVGTKPPQEDPEPQSSETNWEKDEEFGEVSRANDLGEQERAVVIKHQNELGEEELAVAWLPAEESWELISDEQPLKRTSSDGSKEIGVKYTRTLPDGSQETIVKWEKVVSKEEVAALLAAKSAVDALPDETSSTPVDTSEPVAREIEIDTASQVVDTTPEIEPQTTETAQVQPDTSLTDDFRTPDELADSDQHLEVRRGNNLLELPIGNYVVAGAFEEFQHAEDFSDDLFNKGYRETIVGYVSATGYYYTVIYRSSDLNAANDERNRVRTRSGMEKVWVLKVSE